MKRIQLKSTFLAVLATSLLCVASTFPANAQSDYYMTMPEVQANGGTTVTVPVSLNNAGGIFSMQIEVFLPDGVDIVGVEGTERTANAEFFDFAQDDQYTTDNQRYRRIIIGNVQNMAESAISGNEGVLFNITFQLPEGEAVYPIQLKNLQYINPPTFAMNYMDDVSTNITALNYYFTFPEDIEASTDETVIVPLYLNNTAGIYSIQIDLMLPDGVEFVDVTRGERIADAEFFQCGSEDKYTDDGLRYRRTIFANIMNTASAVSGNEGPVLYYKLKMPYHLMTSNDIQETYPIRVMNIQFFNPPTYALEYIADAEGTIDVTQRPLLVGDVNHDGIVGIADVTTMIDMILGTGNGCEICAELDGAEGIGIGDVTTLIDLILSN